MSGKAVKFGRDTLFQIKPFPRHAASGVKYLSGWFGRVSACRGKRRTIVGTVSGEEIDVTTEWLIQNAVAL
jgi:hypothetical protein